MYRESSRIAATAIAVAVWTINTTASAVAIVLLVAVLRSAGAEWVPGIGFWQAVLIRLAVKAVSGDFFKVTLRD